VADKIAISIDHELLEQLETLRRKTKESRSAVLARAARMLLRTEERRLEVDQYLEAYRAHPETNEELAWAAALAATSLSSVEWDE
jgi:metal-responsive CopG/Arc/MetJ family transcriptional regulator